MSTRPRGVFRTVVSGLHSISNISTKSILLCSTRWWNRAFFWLIKEGGAHLWQQRKMEGISIAATSRVSFVSASALKCRRDFIVRRLIPGNLVEDRRNFVTLRCIRAQQSESMDGASTLASTSDSENTEKIEDLGAGDLPDLPDGIKIRRMPSTGPSMHYVGPFEFRLENEGNTPRNILEKIVWHKDAEVAQLKQRKPLLKLKKALENAPPVRDFVGALKASHLRTGVPALIAEVKKASPSRGVLREDFDPVQIAEAYEKGGAACLSVLTDEKFFQGSFDNLEAIRAAGVKCPLLCKEFIIDAWQIFYARSKGADAILLIAAILPDADIRYMTKICKKFGLATLVEVFENYFYRCSSYLSRKNYSAPVHNETEMDRVLGIDGIELIGINNRNLETFEVDIGNTKKLLEGKRGEMIREKGIIVVGESGLFTPDDIAFVQEAGVKAVLVGESLIKQSDPGQAISGLFGKDISS